MNKFDPLARVRLAPVPNTLFPFAVINPEPFTVTPPVPAKDAGHSLDTALANVDWLYTRA